VQHSRPLIVESLPSYRISYVVGYIVAAMTALTTVDALLRNLVSSPSSWGQSVSSSLSITLISLELVLSVNSRTRRVRLEIRSDRIVVPRLWRRIEVRWGEVEGVVLRRVGRRFPYREYLDFILRDGTESALRLGRFLTIYLSGSNVSSDSIELDIASRKPGVSITRRCV
jgi:hypothetical protein